MPGPRVTRPDLRSIRAAAQQTDQQTESAGAHSGAIPAEAEPAPGSPGTSPGP